MSATVLEVVKDIVVAILQRDTAVTSGSADDVTRKVTETFTAVYDTVKKKSQGG